MRGKLFVISAPSGAGKTSLVNAVLPRLRPTFAIERVITYTSRTIRLGERNGHDYHFIEREDFLRRIHEGFFLEWSVAYGNYYGSPRAIAEQVQQGISYIVILDRIGAKTVYQQVPEAILIWITHAA